MRAIILSLVTVFTAPIVFLCVNGSELLPNSFFWVALGSVLVACFCQGRLLRRLDDAEEKLKISEITLQTANRQLEICRDGRNEFESTVSKVIAELNDTVDNTYLERNHLVALLARSYNSGLRPTDIEGWDPDWQNCVYIDLPTGQISYHYHTRESHLFDGLPSYEKPWDGHDKQTVHERLVELQKQLA